MKKSLLIFLSLIITPAIAADRIHVKALEDFDPFNPTDFLNVVAIEDGKVDDVKIIRGDIIHGVITKITTPKRAKIDAGIYLIITHYEDSLGLHEFSNKLSGKYAQTVVSKEEIKKIPPQKVLTKTATLASDLVLRGASYGINFTKGMIENKEDNRFKSGIVNAYKESIFSFIEYGDNINIKKDDEFYLIIKREQD